MAGRKQRRERKAAGGPAGRAQAGEAAPANPVEAPRSWLASRAIVLRYFAVFGACVVLFYTLTATPWFREDFFPAYVELNARLSAAILRLFGEAASTQRFTVRGVRFSLEVQRGCDAIEPSALYAAAVVAMPGPLRHKLVGLGLGVPLLLVTNLLRIVSLYYTGVFFPDAFEVVHVDVWQPLFILAALVLWIAWTFWSLKKRAPEAA